MSHDGLHVNHGSLLGAAADLKTTVNNMDRALTRLEDDIKNQVATWKGDADGQAQAYRTAKAKWDTAITELKDLLDQTSTSVENSNHEYRSADVRGAGRFDFS